MALARATSQVCGHRRERGESAVRHLLSSSGRYSTCSARTAGDQRPMPLAVGDKQFVVRKRERGEAVRRHTGRYSTFQPGQPAGGLWRWRRATSGLSGHRRERGEAEYDAILEGTPHPSPDSRRVAYLSLAWATNSLSTVVNGREEKQYDGITTVPLSQPYGQPAGGLCRWRGRPSSRRTVLRS